MLGSAEFPMTRSSSTRVSALLASLSLITQITSGGNADSKCSTLHAETRCYKMAGGMRTLDGQGTRRALFVLVEK